MKNLLSTILAVSFVAVLAYGGWSVKRWFNYEVGYSSDVKEQVCSMVKKEYLKEGVVCE